MTEYGVPLQRLRAATVKGMMWFGGDQFGRRVIDQIFAVILARLLVPRDYGIVAMAAVFLTFLRVVGSVGMGSAVVQRREVDEDYLSTAYWASLGLGVALTIIAAITGILIGKWLREPLIGLVLSVMSLSFLISAGASTQMAIISRRMDYRTLAFRSMIATVVGGGIGVTMAYTGKGVWSLVGQDLAMFVTGSFLLYRATGWRPKLRFSRAKFVELWSFGSRLQLASFFDYLVRQTDNLLVGRYLGATALGYYSFGYAVFLTPLNDVGLLNRVVFPALSRLQDDARRFRQAFLRITQYVTMLALPMLVGIALVGPLAVRVVFGAKWLPSVPVIQVLTIAGFLRLLMNLWPAALEAQGRPGLRLRLSSYSVLLYLPAFAIGLRWGIIGVAGGYLIATVLLMPFVYTLVVKAIGVTAKEIWAAVGTTLMGCIIMAAAVATLMWTFEGYAHLPALAALVLVIAAGVAIYAGSVWLIEPQTIRGLIRVVAEAIPRTAGRPHPQSAGGEGT